MGLSRTSIADEMREEHRRRVLSVCDDVKFLMGIDFCRFGGWLQVTAGAPIDKAPIVGTRERGLPSRPHLVPTRDWRVSFARFCTFDVLSVTLQPNVGRAGNADLTSMQNHRQGAVIVAVIPMRMMQAPTNEVVNVVAVRNRLMAAVRAVLVSRFMPTGPVLKRASIGIRFAHFDDVFLCMPVTDVLQMTMVQIIDVIPMANSGVATTYAMDVRTFASTLIGRGHGISFPKLRPPAFINSRGPRARLYWPIVLTTLDSGRVLLVEEYLSWALTMSSYFASVVTGSFGTMCTIL